MGGRACEVISTALYQQELTRIFGLELFECVEVSGISSLGGGREGGGERREDVNSGS